MHICPSVKPWMLCTWGFIQTSNKHGKNIAKIKAKILWELIRQNILAIVSNKTFHSGNKIVVMHLMGQQYNCLSWFNVSTSHKSKKNLFGAEMTKCYINSWSRLNRCVLRKPNKLNLSRYMYFKNIISSGKTTLNSIYDAISIHKNRKSCDNLF